MIDLITGPRQTGRTNQMLHWMQQAPEGEVRVCISHSAQEAMRLYRSTWDEEGNPTWAASWQFVSPEDVRNGKAGRLGRHDIRFGVDNADLILQSMLGVTVDKASWETK